MVQKRKICMLGATGVGKTSLVARFVHSIFSDVYRTTVGVTIDKTRITRGDVDVEVVIWDLSGEDEFQSVQLAYLRGASGYLLVVDGTRQETVLTALSLQEAAERVVGRIPLVMVINKADAVEAWDLTDDVSRRLARTGWPIERTSAKTGDGVPRAFARLIDDILQKDECVEAGHELRG
jgi:small GTP-binding protein